MALEKSVIDSVMKALRQIPNSKWEKTHGGAFGKGGKPDISGCVAGRRVEIEVKNERGRLSDLQKREIDAWREAGAIAGVVRSAREALDLIADAMHVDKT